MEFISNNYTLTIIDETDYSLNSVDNLRSYSSEYLLNDETLYSSKHGLLVRDKVGNTHDCILVAGGGASGVHKNSLVILDDRCFVAVGDHVVALSLPNLVKLWAKKLDEATCFGVHYMRKQRGQVFILDDEERKQRGQVFILDGMNNGVRSSFLTNNGLK